MTRVLDELSALLKLEVIEQGIYRGQSQDLGYKLGAKRFRQLKKQLPKIVLFIPYIPIFYALVTLVYLLSMRWKLLEMVQALVLVECRQCKMVKPFFI